MLKASFMTNKHDEGDLNKRTLHLSRQKPFGCTDRKLTCNLEYFPGLFAFYNFKVHCIPLLHTLGNFFFFFGKRNTVSFRNLIISDVNHRIYLFYHWKLRTEIKYLLFNAYLHSDVLGLHFKKSLNK